MFTGGAGFLDVDPWPGVRASSSRVFFASPLLSLVAELMIFSAEWF